MSEDSSVSLNYDLIIIGGGSGGVACSRRATEYGAKVALIEEDRLGGTCVIRGCIPKKLMMYAGNFNETFKDCLSFGWEGIDFNTARFNASIWQQKKTTEINRLENIYSSLLENSKVTVYKGKGVIRGSNVVEVNNKKLNSPKIVIATGGKPRTQLIPGLRDALTSNDILDIKCLPKNIAILGSGYIAMEFASILNNLGVKVSIFYRSDFPLRGFDQDIRKKLSLHLMSNGIELYPKTKLTSLTKNNKDFFLQANNQELKFEKILNALGRTPNLGSVIENLYIDLGSACEIVVNENNES
jgi:glutathione reductase (NADPH)